MRIDAFHRLLPFVALPLAVVWFQNCSPGLHVETDPLASTFKEAEDCINGSADACVFEKNAVSQMGRAVTPENIGGFQVVPVSLSDRDASGYLQNNDFVVTTVSTARWPATADFRQYYSPSNSALEQVMSYVSARKARDWMSALGIFPAATQRIKIYADSSFTGFIPASNEIHLERNGTNFGAALDGSLIVSLYAQANIKFATSGASHDPTALSVKASACRDTRAYPTPYGCCNSALGCGAAIVSGAADYVVAAVFGENRAVVGDGWKNDPAGLSICGIVRDATRNAGLSATAASSTCAARGSPNNATALGAVYASIWWEARKLADNKSSFDRFFLRHLSVINGADDFSTIQSKITSVATTSAETGYASNVVAGLNRRGH